MMIQKTKTIIIAVLCCALTASLALFTPLAAFADLQAGASDALAAQGELKENSWRYQNGELKPEYSGDTELAPYAEGLSAQSGQYQPSDPSMTHLGIDVSEHNGSIDWAAVSRTNVKFAIIRCGFGSDFAAPNRPNGSQDDYKWTKNVEGCQKNNIPFGIYLYSYAKTVDDARSEGQHVVNAIKDAGLNASEIQLPIFYDVEEDSQYELSNETLNSFFYAFRDVLNQNGFTKVGIYSSAIWWRNKWSSVSCPAEYRWIAAWNNKGPFEYGFGDLRSGGIGVWQYGGGTVPGISGEVDMNLAISDWRFLEQTGSSRNMYRLYNPYTGEHFYTSDSAECGNLEGVGWRYEGIAWVAPAESGIPVYRAYNPYVGDHHYTTDWNEYSYITSIGWRGEGVGWYSSSSDQQEVHRLYNPYAKTAYHHFTCDESERDYLASIGWIKEGVAWHGNL